MDLGGQPAKKISLTEVVSDSRDKMRCMVMGSGCQQRMKEELEGERESSGCDVIDCPEPRDSEFRPLLLPLELVDTLYSLYDLRFSQLSCYSL